MPKNLPAPLVVEKNKLNSDNTWLVLLHVTLTDLTEFFFVNNNEDITFAGQVYTAIPFQLDITKFESQGRIPTVTLSISNVTRIMQSYLEALNGAVGSSVTITIVNTGHLEEDYTELQLDYTIIATKSNASWVVFSLGAPNPMRQRFPLHQFLAQHCMWVNYYKGAECAYAGALPTCNGSLDDCKAHSNEHRFGGFPGLNPNAFRLV